MHAGREEGGIRASMFCVHLESSGSCGTRRRGASAGAVETPFHSPMIRAHGMWGSCAGVHGSPFLMKSSTKRRRYCPPSGFGSEPWERGRPAYLRHSRESGNPSRPEDTPLMQCPKNPRLRPRTFGPLRAGRPRSQVHTGRSAPATPGQETIDMKNMSTPTYEGRTSRSSHLARPTQRRGNDAQDLAGAVVRRGRRPGVQPDALAPVRRWRRRNGRGRP